jgi:NADPH-dependent 2,4-dienoyl-CoA reductase/sulfur reductase-like enzyme
LNSAELLIVGGGPAGMNAAIEAAKLGVPCCIVDEGHELGGQIFRDAHPLAATTFPELINPRGDELRSQVAALSHLIQVRSGSVVWGMSGKNRVAIGKEGVGTEFLEPKALIIATGAYEYTPPFPGWTLPGVMTPGAAQILTKTMNVLPGKRVVVAGTGPLLYVVASQLVQKGVEVVEVIEATQSMAWLKFVLTGWRAWDLYKEGLRYITILKKAGVPIRYGRVVTRAAGDGEVQRIYHAPVDADWHPDTQQESCTEADTLCISYGLQSRNYLAQMAGCDIDFDEDGGGWVPARDADLRTSRPDVFAVGDGAGVAGSRIAELEGRLAGLNAAALLSAIEPETLQQRRESILSQLKPVEKVQKLIAHITRVRPGLTTLVDADTIVCRCEEVRWKEVKQAIEYGGHNFRTLKVMTRLGMGMCQGRFCWPAMSRMVARENGCEISEIGPARPRPPIRPVPMDVIGSSAAKPVTVVK